MHIFIQGALAQPVGATSIESYESADSIRIQLPKCPSKPIPGAERNSLVNTNADESIQARVLSDANNDHKEPMEKTTRRNESPALERHPQYRDLQKRLDSFVNFPHHLTHLHQTLAEAGFFYTGLHLMNAVSLHLLFFN